MAKEKNYNNYSEVCGNVAKIYQAPAEGKTGDMRFNLATHRTYKKKDGSKGEETCYLTIHVAPGRRYAKQSDVKVGALIRVIGHNENNSFRDDQGNWKGGQEIGADKIVVLYKREDGKVENSETGQVETIEDAVVDIEEVQ